MKRYIIPISIFWFIAVLTSLIWNLSGEKNSRERALLEGGRAFFRQAVLTRAWNAHHGGVFVPITEKTKPNPHLDPTGREIATIQGKQYTKINPAFMTRQIAEIAEKSEGVRFHITSLNPIRPANKAKSWEISALESFEKGIEEVAMLKVLEDNKIIFRYMAPLIVSKGCLKCHAKQGYKERDIRGGISVSIPVVASGISIPIWSSHIIALLIGLAMIFLGGLKLSKTHNQLIEAKNEAFESRNIALSSKDEAVKEGNKAIASKNEALEAKNVSIKAMEKAKQADKFKSSFLASMSHEIRTPMNAIIGLTDIVLKSKLTYQQKDYLKKVSGSSRHLLSIINDILDFSKIEEGKLEVENIDFMLHHVINEVAGLLGDRSAQKNIDQFYFIDKETPLSLIGDPIRLNQILINLIGNAIKFTDKGEIIIKVQVANEPAAEENQVNLLFSVKDSGIGISPEGIDALFQPFVQADGTTTRKYGGTGLGLSISKQLITLMNGRIWAESVLEEGSTFFFNIPFSINPEMKQYVLLSPVELGNLKVMVVDDHESSRIVLEEMMNSFGNFQVTTVESGEKALKELQDAMLENPYDVVLLDCKMPGMDGFETAGKIKNELFLGKENLLPKIIIATIVEQDEFFQRLKEEKVDLEGFLHKPINSSDLFNVIMEAFGRDEAMVPRLKSEMEEVDLKALEKINGARVLLVEDNFINQKVAIALLEGVGLIVDVAENGRQALEILNNKIKADSGTAFYYELVLMDIEMPQMNGYQATQALRSESKFDQIPIIAMTAHAMKGDREKCLDSGMNDYIAKPIAEQKLCKILYKWIKPGKREIRYDIPIQKKFTPALSVFPSELPGIDLKNAIKQVKGDTILLKIMLLNFLENYEQADDEIRKLLDEGRNPDAERLVHTIKGVSGNLFANDLFQATRELDDALKQNETDKIRPLLESFAKNLAVLIDSLMSLNLNEEAAEPDQEAAEVEIDLAQVAQTMKEIHNLLSNNRISGWQSVESLSRLLPNSRFRSEKNALEKSMSKLDTDKALSILAELAGKLNIFLKGET